MNREVIKGQNTCRDAPAGINLTQLKELGLDYRDGFYHGKLNKGVEVFLLPPRMGYKDVLNPTNWETKSILTGGRGGKIVRSSAGDRTIELVIKPLRPEDDKLRVFFGTHIFPADAAKEIQRAQLIRDQMYYEDEEIVVKYEMPMGFIRHSDGRYEEVFRAYPEAVDVDTYIWSKDRAQREERVKKCLTKLGELYHRDRYRFHERDIRSEETDIMFTTDPRGRTVAIRHDTEFIEVIDKHKLEKDRNTVRETLDRNQIDLSEFEKPGDIIAQLGETIYYMNAEQAGEFLGREVTGRFLSSSVRFCREVNPKGESGINSHINSTLLHMDRIPPEKRVDYLRELTAIMDRSTDIEQFTRETRMLEQKLNLLRGNN